MNACLFVISLCCSKKRERQTITAPRIYHTCDFEKNIFALLLPEIVHTVACDVVMIDDHRGTIDQFQTWLGTNFMNPAYSSTIWGDFSCFFK
jgi:hypothetical protein